MGSTTSYSRDFTPKVGGLIVLPAGAGEPVFLLALFTFKSTYLFGTAEGLRGCDAFALPNLLGESIGAALVALFL